MTRDEQQICLAIGNVRYLPGTWDKRFARKMAEIAEQNPAKELSEGQKTQVYRILYKYRKQMPRLYELNKNHYLCKANAKD